MRSLYLYISLISFSLFAQNVVLEIDTNASRIGEQFNLSLKVYGLEQDSIIWPNIDSVFQEFELLDHSSPSLSWEPDTYVSKNYLLTSFDTGKFSIPSLSINTLFDDSLFTDSLNVYFLATPTDTTNQFFDIKPPKKIPFLTRELMTYFLYVLLLIFLVGGIFLLIRYFTKKEVSPVVDLKPSIPIDIYFLNKLNDLEKKQYLQAEKYKNFYTELSEIFRGYLEMRFDIPALESSTYELKGLLSDLKIQDKWLNNFFRNNDIVKFAKGVPSYEDSVLFLKSIKVFVQDFGVSDVNGDIDNIDKEK